MLLMLVNVVMEKKNANFRNATFNDHIVHERMNWNDID